MKKIKPILILFVLCGIAYYAYTHFPVNADDPLYYGEAIGDSYSVYASTSGILETLSIAEGDTVETGQVVAVLAYKDLDEQLAIAEKDVSIASKQLDKVGAPARNEEIAVLENALAASIANRDLISSNLNKVQIALQESDVALLHGTDVLIQSQKDYDNTLALFDAGIAAQSELDKAGFALNQAKSNADALSLQHDLAGASITEIEKQYKINNINQDTARQNLALAQAGAQDDDRQLAALALEKAVLARDRIQKQIDAYTVSTYQSGVVETLLYNVGEFVSIGSPLMILYDPQVLKAKIYVKESDLPSISIGQTLSLVPADNPDSESIAGTIEHIADQAMFTPVNIVTVEDRERLVFEVTLDLTRTEGLRPGMLLAVDIRAAGDGGDSHE